MKTTIFPLLFVTAFIQISLSKKKDSFGVREFLDKEKKKFTAPCPKKITSSSINRLRWTAETDQAISCILVALDAKENDGFQWSALGTLYQRKGQTSQAVSCFKHASKLSGKVSPFVTSWDFIGPFVIGKMELDGDPLEPFGGVFEVSKKRNNKNIKFFSELVPGGEIKWKSFKQSVAGETIKISPQVNWNDLVNSLSSIGITEWQGWVVGEFAVNEKDQLVVFQCLDVHTFYIDGRPMTGDVYRRDVFWTTTHLSQGVHTIYIRLRSKVSATFKCSIKIPESSLEILPSHFLPDLVNGHLFGKHVAVPMTNNHHSKWVRVSKVSVTDQSEGHVLRSHLLHPVNIAPGQTVSVLFSLETADNGIVLTRCTTLNVILSITTSMGTIPFKVNLRCRKPGESFLFTFLDHDGSVQHAAAIAPISGCGGAACPTLLTLHGTTVPPQNQADSYKVMRNGEYVFGIPHGWLLAPTRHGAHNWEGPGSLTAIAALDRLVSLTQSCEWITEKADNSRVLFAGHSMGGHGAWHLATHFPDRALGLLSLAGWIKKEEYGDSNLFFRHDLATSHVDPATKSVMEACIAENDADRHVTNLQDIPVFARIGANDRTVHPFFMRRMYRLLSEIQVMINYTELPDKEHWWWDTWETNDGGVVNDRQLREFTDSITQTDASCDSEGCDRAKDNKYTLKREEKFIYTCYNPALGEGLNGLQIIQQRAPLRLSTIEGFTKNDQFWLKTTNVRSFLMMEPKIRRMEWKNKVLKIDDTVVDIQDTNKFETDGVLFCNKKGDWVQCDVEGRKATTYGPARRVAERPFVIVIDMDSEYGVEIQSLAVYIANLFFLTSDTFAPIVRLSDVTDKTIDESNLIILSLLPTILGALELLPDLTSTDSVIKLGDCKFAEPRSGLMTLAPHKTQKDGLVMFLSANSIEGLRDVVSLATPTIPPMTRSPFSNLLPDYVVTGPDFGWKGPGGFLCAGFWGNHWEYRPDLSSCVCHS
ncbi:uncharacterized secreted protein ARB_06907-like [Mizuhopecten yessoensis]|uniref:Peptidase S9 prolyl oligopeptidase catalytic domain-containing protein n=1 Tax=Mizuhopecten yessoensis TaxID=6573 RepID=A0A210QCY6_MIZYE|nr:uncharacterized secreted protein ARB_06907-like [Mizuhopecten yessoensis]OWF46589.1 hypothetical protein KP79_PYT10347 [Mizuhopecten yessoensis]